MQGNRNRLAALSYLVFFLPSLLGVKDEFAKYHAKQAVGLLIIALALQGAMTILLYWGIGWSFPMVWAIRLFLAYEVFTGMRNAIGGHMKPLPVFGHHSAKL